MIVQLFPNLKATDRMASDDEFHGWKVPAHDRGDDPHTIRIGYWFGSVRPDGSPHMELERRTSADVGILTADEARAIAAALVAAADYADHCTIVEG